MFVVVAFADVTPLSYALPVIFRSVILLPDSCAVTECAGHPLTICAGSTAVVIAAAVVVSTVIVSATVVDRYL
jgi:hypothetical protein